MTTNSNKKDWFKDRGYLHFTNRTPINKRPQIEKYVSNPRKVQNHSFAPLIQKHITQRRYKASLINGMSRRSHKEVDGGVFIPSKKIRDILYATHIDAHIYSYYTQKILAPLYEEVLNSNFKLNECVTAYRQMLTDDGGKFKNNVHFAKDAFDEIKRRKECVALTFDIKNFFPSLNHALLKKIWCELLETKSLPKDHYNIYKAVTKFSYVNQKDLRTVKGHFDEKEIAKNKKIKKYSFFRSIKDLLESDIQIYKNENRVNNKIAGIPQGLPISAILANLYMLPFDKGLVNDLVLKRNVFYRRYSDDIIVICDKGQEKEVENIVYKKIAKINLIIAPEKTEKFVYTQELDKLMSYKFSNEGLLRNVPLNYLGFEFYGYQTLIKSKNLAFFYREMKETIRRKSNRVNSIKEKKLIDYAPLFKRKIYRLYSYQGIKKRKIYKKNETRIYRGNYIKYAYRASEELNAPEIKKQLNNHWKVLQRTLKKYDFSNVKDQDTRK
ncbi:reverse transcriptase domain-containing protein [Leeuwenhoekiella sp. H156]|uniref:reverse transcriptase domain-containing protein n=1 Tax=Leeuwenhoekiella sp. H156 TaxID=3450128 RepID=UPI003FA454C3